ncbi:putative RNA-dependent RNA polymerase [Ceratocystis polonica partitivirus]|uniref:Putative RNA-dependent RNA polymerase n=1 Tax=Ceratocystis polonica partitivirus TaxID=235434 RepID=Q6X9T6_9VIRU|nr:putative RNA-dependent RNA polymerase [Ceratocystis polonica partitivirus]AAP79988.1 putative RNA-dependent RNA polymerase [Ceratocystis polonica partitivirus]
MPSFSANPTYQTLIDDIDFDVPIAHPFSVINTDLQPVDDEETVHDLGSKDFEFYKVVSDNLPPTRAPSIGIESLPNIRYHNHSNDHRYRDQPPTGPPPMRGVRKIINDSFPQYLPYLKEWCRPKTSSDAIFEDFNQPQIPSIPLSYNRKQRILNLVNHFMGVKPYDIVHFCDTRFYPWDLSKKADYFHNHSNARKRHAQTSHASTATGPTKKSWFINAHLFHDRSTVHNIKLYGLPFKPHSYEARNKILLELWFKKIPTELLVRSHISNPKKLKVRPVNNAPMIFLRIECMLFYPLLAQLRKQQCSIMYGLETIRGGMMEIESLATRFSNFMMIDWSKFDQTVPFTLVDMFYQDWIPTLILVDSGYAKIHNYNDHVHSFAAQARKLGVHGDSNLNEAPPEAAVFANKVENLLKFINTWFKEMVYITPDGFAYSRTFAGVPSGILCTQLIDSFVNLVVLIDSLFEFGFHESDIKSALILLMGDDNVVFAPDKLSQLHSFFKFLPDYAKKRWNMKVNVDKSIFTTLRRKIEILGYTNNYGMPVRSLSKLIGQLAYPERHVNDSDMCMRAIGFAWCAAASDSTFHDFCRKVFIYYYARVNVPIKDLVQSNASALPGMFFAYRDVHQHIKLDHFPSIEEVRQVLSKHHGYLTEEPLWKYDFFLHPKP